MEKIFHIKMPHLPAFRFEWHPGIKRVYVIRIGPAQEVGDPIAHDIETHGAAITAALIWSRGYREATRELGSTRKLALV